MCCFTSRKIAIVLALALCAAGAWYFLSKPGSQPAVEAASPRTVAGGYSAAFDAELKKIGQISPQEFAKLYASKAEYLDKLSWDPTTAKFWDLFNLDPNAPGAQIHTKVPGNPNPQLISAEGKYDFRPNAEELAVFKKNGFVVSERTGAATPTDMYYRIYGRDLPVFITCDSILHAWHRSYDAILEDLELNVLSPSLLSILSSMAAQIPETDKQYGQGVLHESLQDADFFLGVAQSLLIGATQPTKLKQDARVAGAIQAAHDLRMEKYELFGRIRDMDFSQFNPRGHYEKSEQLRRYFRAMMWCGRIDLRIAGDPNFASPRELGAAVVLHDLLKRSGKFDQWQKFDEVIQTFVGKTDSMTFAHMGQFLNQAGIDSPAKVDSVDLLAAIQKQIMGGKFGFQEIRGDVYYVNPDDPAKFALPRSFTVLGQKFVVDSWVLSNIVYDDVTWKDEKIHRRIPSGLDVAFAALGNDLVVPGITARIESNNGRLFRDGLNYQHNLAVARNVVDGLPSSNWKENLYTSWLGCLRELSKPTTGTALPESMRTKAWANKTLNAQLASWTQLRHDTVLYAKPSYTKGALCYYPAGFVEPIPDFWQRIEAMAIRGADLMAKLPTINNVESLPDPTQKGPSPPRKEANAYGQRYGNFLREFGKTMGVLKSIAIKELAELELSKEETKFLENVVEVSRGSGGDRTYYGWYPNLFFQGIRFSACWDALVADIHTDVPSLTPFGDDPGCVLHQGVGNVDLLLIAIDNGKDRMVYAGPVLSHYEFEMPNALRMTDSEWQKNINQGKLPPRPEWTRSYLVPGVNPEAKGYTIDEKQK